MAFGVVVLAAGHERRLAHAERLKRGADLAVEPHRAQPALGLVLGRVGERHRRSRQCDHEGRVLRQRFIRL